LLSIVLSWRQKAKSASADKSYSRLASLKNLLRGKGKIADQTMAAKKCADKVNKQRAEKPFLFALTIQERHDYKLLLVVNNLKLILKRIIAGKF
jgi:hypothetical protein